MKRMRVAGAAVAAAVLGAASVAVAGNRADAEAVAPMAEHVRASTAGYTLQVHPAFSSGVSVSTDAADTWLYRQQGIHTLPAGQTQPPAQHVVRLQGGQFGRDVGLVVNDPRHHIARITVELYDPAHKPGEKGRVVERVVVNNAPVLCPPICPTGGGGSQ